MKTLLIFLFFLLNILTVSSQESVQITSDSAKISIRFTGARSSLIPIHNKFNPSIAAFRIENSRFREMPADSTSPALEQIAIVLALPFDNFQSPFILKSSEREIFTGEIASVSEFYGGLKKTSVSSVHSQIQILPLGIIRGIQLVRLEFQPFRYDANTNKLFLSDSVEIVLPFLSPIQIVKDSIRPNIGSLFLLASNKSLIPSLIHHSEQQNLTHRRNSENLISTKDTWFSPLVHYLKLTTKYDGIARLKYADIDSTDNYFQQNNLKYFHLILNGNEIPMSIMHDTDGIFNAGDELYFASHRPFGDTSWFNMQSNETTMYLAYDESSAGLRFSNFDNISASQSLDSVNIFRHFEEDRVLWEGDPIFGYEANSTFRTSTVPGESWYWSKLQFIKHNPPSFSYFTVCTPLDSSSQNIQILFKCHAANANQSIYLDHYFEFFVNTDSVGNEIFDGFKDVLFQTSLPSNTMLAGQNQLTIKIPGVPINRELSNYVEIDYIDFLSVSGIFKPFASAGILDCSTDSIGKNSNLTMSGFSSPAVFVMDSLHKKFDLVRGISGSTIRCGVKSGQNAVASFVINDSVAYFESKGLFISADYAPKFPNPFFFQFPQPNSASSISQIQAIVNSAASGSVFSILYNFGSPLPIELQNLFSLLGSISVKNIQSGSWLFTFVKNGSVLSEKIGIDGQTLSFSKFLPNPAGKSYQTSLPLSAGMSYSLVSVDSSHVETPKLSLVNSSNLRDTSIHADVFAITHQNFQKQAQRWANYRSAKNNLKIRVVLIDDIIKEFGFGQKSPEAIKNFLTYYENREQTHAPTHVVIFGDASWNPCKFYNPKDAGTLPVKDDFVPSYGRPASDFWYGQLCDTCSVSIIPQMIVSRISVETPEQADAIIDKIVSYEALPQADWMQNFLFLTGPITDSEVRAFNKKAVELANEVVSPFLCVRADTVLKTSIQPVDNSQSEEIKRKINNGVGWASYSGHGAVTVIAQDFGVAKDLANASYTGILTTFSCLTGAFADPFNTSKNEDYARIAGKGFVATVGTTGFGIPYLDDAMQQKYLDAIAFDSLRTIGDLLYKSKLSLYRGGFLQPEEENTIQQYSLLGDPFVELRMPIVPDIYIAQSDVHILNEPIYAESDSAFVSAIVRKFGLYIQDSVRILLIREFKGKMDSIWSGLNNLCQPTSLKLGFQIKNMIGQHNLTAIIDPHNLLNQNQANDTVHLSFNVNEVPQTGNLTVQPNPLVDGNTQIIFFADANVTNSQIEIFNIQGRLVRIFEMLAKSGKNIISWDGTDEFGQSASSGVYILRVFSTAGTSTKMERTSFLITR